MVGVVGVIGVGGKVCGLCCIIGGPGKVRLRVRIRSGVLVRAGRKLRLVWSWSPIDRCQIATSAFTHVLTPRFAAALLTIGLLRFPVFRKSLSGLPPRPRRRWDGKVLGSRAGPDRRVSDYPSSVPTKKRFACRIDQNIRGANTTISRLARNSDVYAP